MSINLINYALAKKDWNKAYEDLKVLEKGGRNLIQRNLIEIRTPATVDLSRYTTEGYLTIETGESAYAGIRWAIPSVKPNKYYTLSYSYRKISGKLVSFGGHTDDTYIDNTVYVDGVKRLGTRYIDVGSVFVGDDNDWHEVVVVFKTGDTVDPTHTVQIQPNRGYTDAVKVEIKDLVMVEGDKATPWTPAPEDINAHPFVAELAETVYRSKQNEERIRNLENALTALGGGS